MIIDTAVSSECVLYNYLHSPQFKNGAIQYFFLHMNPVICANPSALQRSCKGKQQPFVTTALWWHQHCLCCLLEVSGSELSALQSISVKLPNCNFGNTNRWVLGIKAGGGFPEMSLMLTGTLFTP